MNEERRCCGTGGNFSTSVEIYRWSKKINNTFAMSECD